jgi:NADH-quinone oxidoreductase subunit J
VEAVTFYFMAILILVFAASCIVNPNPIYSALFLALTMVSLAFVFFMLKAFFIAGVQLIVYAGAVMVLFVMVLMLFDLKKETLVFSKGKFSGFLKILSAGILCGIISRAVLDFRRPSLKPLSNAITDTSTKDLARILYTDYMLGFQVLGLLLLVIAIGAVAVSRIRGGTHARS